MRLDFCRKRAQDKHELHQEVRKTRDERDYANLQTASLELNIVRLETYIRQLEADSEEKLNSITSLTAEVNRLELLLEENRSIAKDYMVQIEKKFQDIQRHCEKKEFEFTNKMGLLEKQLRVKTSQVDQIKVESQEEISVLERAKSNTETLLHQEQVLHRVLRDEMEASKEDITTRLSDAAKKHQDLQRRAIEMSDTESQLLSQNNTLKAVTEERAERISSLLKEKANLTEAFENEKQHFASTETNLRMQVHRLRDAIKEMKSDMETVESEDMKKLKEREDKLAERERQLAKELATLQHTKSNPQQGDSYGNDQMKFQLEKVVEESVVLRQEKQALLERCNKLAHELKRAKLRDTPEHHHQEDPLEEVENIQYELTKKQLGLMALERQRAAYNPSEYTGLLQKAIPEHSFLDSEIISLSSFPNTEITHTEAEMPVKLIPKSKSKPMPQQPVNYNSLK